MKHPQSPTIFYYQDAGLAADHLAQASVAGYWVATQIAVDEPGRVLIAVAVGCKA